MPDDEWERFDAVSGEGLPELEEEATSIVNLADLEPNKSPARAFLLVLAGTSTGQMQRVGQGVTIGRSQRADMRVSDEGASRLHARVYIERGVTYLQDLRSANGTRLNGERVTDIVALRDGDKIQIGATCLIKFSFQDDLEEKFQRGMYEAALRDGLTKAFNKKALMDHLKSEFAFADRHKTMLSLIMFDLDHFKNVNDTYGHPAGDYVLRSVAELVQATIRQEDFFARYGGEEFVIVCRGVTDSQTAVLAERLRASIAYRTFSYDERMIPVTVSLGVVALPAASIENLDGFIGAVDTCLYQAKHAGRNRVVVRPRG